VDELTHAIEAYVTTLHNPYTDMLAERSMRLLGGSLRQAVRNGTNDDEARYDVSLAATLGGQAFVNSGLGAVHALTYPLGIEYGLGHGLANAVLLPYVIEYNLPATPERYANIARFLGYEPSPGDTEMDVARGAVSAVHELNADIGIPADTSGFGEMNEEDFERFTDIAFEYSEHNIDRNPRTLDRDDVAAIFRNAYRGQ
jgi:alcohol dehydrogenase